MDIWTVVIYVVTIIINIGAVAVARDKAMEKGKMFLASGKGAYVLLMAVSIAEQILFSQFEVLRSADSIVGMVQNALTMTAAAMGTHTALTSRSK